MVDRKVIVQELVSADGFVAGPAGELDFFEAVSDYSGVDRDNLELLESVDTVLLGAATYRMFVEYWPTAEGELVADAVNTTPKVVYSSTLDAAPWGRFEPARVERGSAVDHVRSLRGQPGGDILLWGSISVARSLLGAGLVDEVYLNVLPVAIGAGRRLFAAGQRLVLREANALASGIVTLRYRLMPG